MSNPIDQYMEKVKEMMLHTQDPFAKSHSDLFLEIIREIAQENWLKDGEPILSEDQMDEVYTLAQNKCGDKSWQIVGGFNICMN